MGEKRAWYPLPFSALVSGYIIYIFRLGTGGWQDYALPFAGFLLICWSFAQMRGVSPLFETVWSLMKIIMVFQVVEKMVGILGMMREKDTVLLVGAMNTIMGIALLLTFQKALAAYEESWGKLNTKNPLFWMTACYTMSLISLLVLIAMGVPDSLRFFIPQLNVLFWISKLLWVFPILLLAGGIVCVVVFCKKGKYINTRKPEAVSYSDIQKSSRIVLVYAGVFIIVMTAAAMSAGRTRMNFTDKQMEEDFTGKEEMVKKGFSERMQRDMPEEYREKFREAAYIRAYPESFELKGGKGKSNTVYVEFPNHEIYLIEHFALDDRIPVWNCRFALKNTEYMEYVCGEALCTKNGFPMAATLEEPEDIREETLLGSSVMENREQKAGEFYFPFDSSERRVYMIYRMKFPQDVLSVSHMFILMHHPYPYLQIPYKTACEEMEEGSPQMERHMSYYNLKEGNQEWGVTVEGESYES